MAHKVFALPTNKLLNAFRCTPASVNEKIRPKENKKEGRGFIVIAI